MATYQMEVVLSNLAIYYTKTNYFAKYNIITIYKNMHSNNFTMFMSVAFAKIRKRNEKCFNPNSFNEAILFKLNFGNIRPFTFWQ